MTDDAPPLESIEPGIFSEAVATAAVEKIGADGAWLLLSTILYGWRAYYDLAVAAVTGDDPGRASLEDAAWPPAVEFQVVKDLQVQGLMYAAAEQFLSLLRACRNPDTFLDSFTDSSLHDLITDAQTLTRDDLSAMLAEPKNVEETRVLLAEELDRRKVQRTGRRPDLLQSLLNDTTQVGPFVVPSSFIDRGATEGSFESTRTMVDLIHKNIDQLRGLTDAPDDVDPQASERPQSLREIDNSFRHGLRLLFRRAVPKRREFATLGGSLESLSPYAVDVYLPRGKGTVRFGTVDANPERTQGHLATTREICTRTGQLSRAFLGGSILGDGRLAIVASGLHLPGPPTLATGT